MNNILIIHNPYSGNQKNFDIIKDSLIKIGKDNNYYIEFVETKKKHHASKIIKKFCTPIFSFSLIIDTSFIKNNISKVSKIIIK